MPARRRATKEVFCGTVQFRRRRCVRVTRGAAGRRDRRPAVTLDLPRVALSGGVFRIAPGGRIARHPAGFPQILAVLEGSGEVSDARGVYEPIAAGEAVFWLEGEKHETKTTLGLTAVIIEGHGLDRFGDLRRPLGLLILRSEPASRNTLRRLVHGSDVSFVSPSTEACIVRA